MALPDSRMSIVLALSAAIFHRRAEVAFKDDPLVACLEDFTLDGGGMLRNPLVFTHPDPNETHFLREDDDVHLRIAIKVGATLDDYDFLFNAYVRLQLVGEIIDDARQTVALAFIFVSIDFQINNLLSEGDQATLRHSLAEFLEPVLDELRPDIPLAAVLSSSAELVDPVALRLPGTLPSALTLVVGLEVAGDADVDHAAFYDVFEANPRGSFEWSLSVDSGIMRDTIDEELANRDFTEEAPDDNGIDDWVQTEETRVYWSGDDVAGELLFPWHENDVRARFAQHPIWFKIIGIYRTDAGHPVLAYVLGEADLLVTDDDEGQPAVFIDSFLFAAGWTLNPIPAPLSDDDQPDPIAVTSANVTTDGLRIANIAWDESRLTFNGADDHSGMPGNGVIQAPTAVDVIYDKGGRGPCQPFIIGVSGQDGSVLTDDNTVTKSLWIGNTGLAPLWLCHLNLEDPDGVFQVQADLPLSVAPGQFGEIGIRLTVTDEETHTASLTIRTNDPNNQEVVIALSGRLFGSDLEGIYGNRLACVEKPEDIPPQEWFEILGELLTHPDDVVKGDLTPEHELEITLAGLPSGTIIHVLDDQGQLVAQSVSIDSFHHLSVPTEGNVMLKVSEQRLPRAADMALRLSIGRNEPLVHVKARETPQALAMDERNIIYALFHERLALFNATMPTKAQEIANYRCEGAQQLGLYNYLGLVATPQKLLGIDVRNPFSPTLQHEMPLAEEVHFQIFVDHLVLFSPTSVSVYRLEQRGSPMWEGELETKTPLSAVAPLNDGVALIGKEGGYVMPALTRLGLQKARRLETLPPQLASRLQPTTLASFYRYRLAPLQDGGFAIVDRRAGDLPIDADAVRTYMQREDNP